MRQHKLKVHEALERVRMAHPYAASGGIAPSPRVTSEAAALWTRLLELDSSALDQAIVNLSEYDVRVVLFAAAGRLGDPRPLDVLERVLVVRRLLRVGEAGWLAYVVSNGRTSFRRSACHYAESESGREVWIDLAQSAAPLDRAVERYHQSGLVLAKWLELPEVALSGKSLVVKRIRARALSQRYMIPTVARESPETLVAWVNQVLTDQERIRWYRDYLNATHTAPWDVANALLIAIMERFGDPDPERTFWAGVSGEAIRAIERWIRNVQLTRLLGEGERVDFWRRFLEHIRETLESASGEAVFICFDDWFAVQFRQPGAATYMFSREHLERLRDLRRYRLYVMVRLTPRIGRYEHRGFWQPAAEAEVRRVLRERQGL